MGRQRNRSRSYSPLRRSRTPTSERKRYDDDPRDRHGSHCRRSPLPSGLLIRNLPLDARPEDLRVPFERYGPVKDVYLPKNYYTAYSRSPSPARHDSRYQRGRDYHCSPRQSRSVSQDRAVRDDYRSPSQARSMSRDHGAKDDYRSSRRPRSVSQSLSPHSPHGDREYRTKQRSPSPRENVQSPHDERDHVRSSPKSPRRVNRSPSRSRSRSLSPRQQLCK